MKAGIASLCVVLATFSAWASTPNLNGTTWAGTAKGTSYRYVSSTGTSGNSKNVVKSGSATLSATFAQSGGDLTINMSVSPKNDVPFTVVLTGYVGNNAFWVTGVEPPQQSGDSNQTFYFTGYIGKGSIKGLGVEFGGDDTEIVYSLKQSKAAVAARDAEDDAETQLSMAPRDGGSVTQVAGTFTGLQTTLTGTAKTKSVKATFTGVFTNSPDDTSTSATIAYKVGGNTLNFNNAVGPKTGDTFVIVGLDSTGTYTLVASIHGNGNGNSNGKSGKGLAFIFSTSSFDDLKVAAKVLSGGN